MIFLLMTHHTGLRRAAGETDRYGYYLAFEKLAVEVYDDHTPSLEQSSTSERSSHVGPAPPRSRSFYYQGSRPLMHLPSFRIAPLLPGAPRF